MAVIAAPAPPARDLRDRVVRRAEVVGIWATDCLRAHRKDTDWAADLLGDVEHRHEHATLDDDGYHVDSFAVLEDQLTTWEPESGDSPDRLDALVWALTHLMLGQRAEPRIRRM